MNVVKVMPEDLILNVKMMWQYRQKLSGTLFYLFYHDYSISESKNNLWQPNGTDIIS